MTSSNPYVQGLLNQLFGLEGKISIQRKDLLNYYSKNTKIANISDLSFN